MPISRKHLCTAWVLTGLSIPGSAQAQWPTTEFRVISGETALPGPAGSLLVDAFNAASDQLDEWLVGWSMEPTGARIYVADAETRQEIEGYLSETAELLERWGFPPPVLPTEDGRYEVVLAAETPAALSGGTAAGTYHPPVCGIVGGRLFFSAKAILADGGSEDGGPAVTPRGRTTLAHELFHAVQTNTQFLGGVSCLPGAGAWIVEATADAVGIDVLRVLRGEEVPNWVEAWGARDYSKRLPVPRELWVSKSEWTADDLAPYYTSSFWRYLAEYQASRVAGGGWPGPEPPGKRLDYSYLAFVLEQGKASVDCFGSGAACNSELRWLDAGLRSWFNRSLREIYPRFGEVLALYGNHRLTSADGGRWWRDAAFGGCPYVELKPGAQDRIHRDVIPSFEPVSMRCWTVLVTEFGTDVPIEVSVEGPPGGTALADLSAAVGGPPIWADTAVVQTTAGDERLSVRWVVNASPGGGNYVVLTNVARDPAATTRLQNLPITFTALEPYAVLTDVTPGSDPSGASTDITTGPGPSGADVDQPLGVRLDHVPPAVLADGSTTQYRYDPALIQPCLLRALGLSNEQGDGLSFSMDHEGPIGPGEYPVADGREYEGFYDRLPPDQVLAGFGLGFLNQPPAEQLQSFIAIAGSLVVESVAGRFVTGKMYLTGENSRARAIARGWEDPPANYLPGAAIRVEFGLLMRDPGDPVGDSDAVNCLTSDPIGGAGKAASASTGSAPDPGDSEESSESSGSDESDEAGGASAESPPEPGTDVAAAATDDPAPRPSDADVAELGPGQTRWVSVRAEGRPDLSFHGSDVDGSAGVLFSCHGTAAPASISLFKGEPGVGELELGALTAAIPEGATGSFPLSLVQYVVGGRELEWTETGTLEITRHDASSDPASRRIAGRILGLGMRDGPRGETIPIEADFDMNAACVEFGR